MDADQRASLEDHLARMRAQRAELREAASALDDALDHPLGTPAWRGRVHTALIELAHDFRDHIELSESAGGLVQTVLEQEPRLSPGIERQREEHVALDHRIQESIAVLEREDTSPVELTAVREDLTSLVGDLVRHRQHANDLLYEAFSVDLGGRG